MKKFFLFGLLFGAFWLITGCRGEIPTGMDAPTITLTLMVDSSRALSPTISPSLTPTPNPTATPTSTPSSTPFEVLPLMTSHEAWPEVTPIATPVLSVEDYRLKTWTEADALALIHTMEVYAHDNDVPAPAHGRFEFPEAYGLVELAVREMQYSFPNSVYQEKVDWRLAMAHVIQGGSSLDEWILQTIENFLSQHPLSELDEYLFGQGFLIGEQVVVPNLMGDNRPAIVLRVQAQDNFGDQGLVFALQLDEQGTYQLFPIHSFWTIIASGERIVDTLDHNKNGIPEVVLETYVSSGSMCGMTVYIYEWRENEFVDLTQDQISTGNCDLWSFGEPDVNGIDTIFITSLYGREDIFKWNGQFYELGEFRFPNGAMFCSDYTLFLDTWPDDTGGLEVLQALLKDWPEEELSHLNPGCQDYLRFQIGMTYALHDQYSDALATFQNLAQSPANSKTTYISSATQAFLKHYKRQADLYASCIAAQTSFDELSSFEENWELNPLCNWATIFPLFIQSLNPAEIADPKPILEQAGTKVYDSTSIDVDGDNDLDWILVTSHASSRANVWVLLNLGESFQALSLDYYVSLEELSGENDLKVETFLLPGVEGLFTILWLGDEFDIYQLGQPLNNDLVSNVYRDWDVQTYEFQQANHIWGLEISYTSTSTLADAKSYFYWDNVKRDFLLLPFEKDYLLTENGPREFLPYLERLVSTFPFVPSDYIQDRVHYLYLLGLAYELTGDTQHALETYWTIWHDHPDTGYARMACSKIENCVP